MKVKIVKSSYYLDWYINHIGEEFQVDPQVDYDGDYQVIQKDKFQGYYISSKDCKEVKEETMGNIKVNDKVKIIGEEYPHMKSIGKQGKVVDLDGFSGTGRNIRVRAEGATWCYKESELELIPEEQQFTKADLRTGMLVQLRNGDVCIVMFGVKEYDDSTDLIVDVNDGNKLAIDEFDDDLTDADEDTQYDIVKVIECDYVGDVFRGIRQCKSPLGFTDVKVLYERPNPKVEQLKKRIDELKGELEKAEDELKNIC
jgi:hypothetical protein